MRRGRKGLPDEIKAARGTFQPCRAVVSIYPDHASRPDPAVIPAPAGMTPEAAAIWDRKVDRYRQRGQKIGGFEDSLRHYCELEAALNAAWPTGNLPSMAALNTYRIYAAEFFDTPAAQRVSANGKPTENPFTRNGRRAAGE